MWVPGDGRLPVLAPIPAGRAFTFAVLGDNRGSASGELRPVFAGMMAELAADQPAFILQTGDMISGYARTEKTLRKQWKPYVEALRAAGIPVFHSPGNHDLHDETSARVYRELWGETRYAFDYGGARFIALDTETISNRLGEEQEGWLAGQLESAAGKRVFLFFHSPLFPVDGHKGSSLDKHPKDRDRLHALFVRYKDRVKGVYVGHEHLYDFHEIDGIPYYITGGGGAPLYAKPEGGGFNHYLLVHVAADGGVKVEVHAYGEKRQEPAAPAVRATE